LRHAFGRQTTALRREGLIPAELYGRGIANIHLAVPAKEFRRAFQETGESTMLTLEIKTHQGTEQRPVMIHAVTRDPLSDTIVHVDFYQVRLDERIRVKVPLSFVGIPPAVKEGGGIFVKLTHELEAEALPDKLPHAFEVSVAGITEIGGSVHAKDIVLPEGVRLLAQPETSLATVMAKPTEEEEQKLAEEVKVEEIKAESEEKKTERAKEKEAAPAEGAAPAAEKKPEKK